MLKLPCPASKNLRVPCLRDHLVSRRDYRRKGVTLLYETVSGIVHVDPENLSSQLAGRTYQLEV